MQVRVLFFGVLKDLTGRASEALTLPDQATAADVIQHCKQRFPSLKGALSSIAISVNQEYADPNRALMADDEVGLLPPVSGGSPSRSDSALQSEASAISIVRQRIDTAAVLAKIKQPEDGAVVVFEGIVRNHTRDRRTLFLEYEAYEEMAKKQLESLAAQARSQFSIREVAIVHRLGRLEITEASVLIAVASAHRAAAFEACRWLIDTLKHTVPIWKKEHFEDGAVWADGEPFPENLPAGQFRGAAHPTE
jgi:molybdopterin converting factor subunit 1